MYAATLKNSAKPNALSIRSVRLRAWRHDHKRSASHNDNVNDDAPSTAPPAFAAVPLTASQTQRTPCSKNRCFPVFESRGLRIAHQYTCNMHAWATPEVAPSTAAASCMRAADVAMTRLDLCSEVVTSFVALSSWDVVLSCTLCKCDPWATNTTDLPPPRRTPMPCLRQMQRRLSRRKQLCSLTRVRTVLLALQGQRCLRSDRRL